MVDTEDVEFASDDLDATEDFLSRVYTRLSLNADGERSSAHFVRRWMGDINADKVKFDYTLAFDANPLERVCLGRIRSGRIIEHIYRRPTEVFESGDVRLFSPPELPFSGQLCGPAYDLVMFDSRLLDRVASAPGRGDEPVRLLGQQPITKGAERQLSAVMNYVHALVFGNPDACQSPLVVGTVGQHVAASVLAALPNSALTDPTIQDRRDSTPVLFRRAKMFIDDNAHRDISLADVARAVYVTPRALQYMFRKHMDCTPMEYLRRARLHQAHHELLAGDHHRTTVAAIAAKWGFGHTGRFALYYRETYGQSPHTTLRSGA